MHRGELSEYLGMDLDFETIPGCLLVSTIKYLQKVIEEWPEQLTGTKTNPANDNVFKICDDDDRKLLDKGRAKQFRCTVAQLCLCGCAQGRIFRRSCCSLLQELKNQTKMTGGRWDTCVCIWKVRSIWKDVCLQTTYSAYIGGRMGHMESTGT